MEKAVGNSDVPQACDMRLDTLHLDQVREKLLKSRDEITTIAAKVHTQIGLREVPLDPNSAERAIELENLDVLHEIDQESKVALRLISRALKRIEAGTYGLCSECGGKIHAKRLSVIPYIDTCVDCAIEPDERG